MDNFCQFWNKVDGEPYKNDKQPHSSHELRPITEPSDTSSYELKPLTDEDMARYSDEDVAAEMEKKKAAGFNPCKLGPPMSDEEFHKFYGLDFK